MNVRDRSGQQRAYLSQLILLSLSLSLFPSTPSLYKYSLQLSPSPSPFLPFSSSAMFFVQFFSGSCSWILHLSSIFCLYLSYYLHFCLFLPFKNQTRAAAVMLQQSKMESISSTCLHPAFKALRSQNQKKLHELTVFFALSGSLRVKAARKMIGKLTPGVRI